MKMEKNEKVDVLVILTKVGKTEEITLRNGEPKQRRVINMIDDSNYSIACTI